MPTKPTLDGRNARLIFNELHDRSKNVNKRLLDLLERYFKVGDRDNMEITIKALRDETFNQDVLDLLKEGRFHEAEDTVLGISNRGH